MTNPRTFNEYSARQKEATENYTTALKRAIRYARDEAEADTLVADAKEEYDRVSAECAASLERIKAEFDREYVTDIVMYQPDKSWVLVIVHFVDGSER